MIRIDTVWLGVEPLDMRAGTEAALARVVRVFGAAHPHHAYLFANRRANRMKVLVHYGIDVWLAARRLNQGKFVWPRDAGTACSLTHPQLDALVLGLPWQRIGEAGGCLAHARRKFFDLWANHKSTVAEEALKYFVRLYEVEREVQNLDPDERRRIRQLKARPVADALNKWLTLQRQKVPDGSATAKAIDYGLNRWAAQTRYLDDGDLPADNNWGENQIRRIAIGRNDWLFAGSLRAGKRAAAVMSLVHSARLKGHEPYAYLKDVLERLPTQPASRVKELLPHRWQPTVIAS